MVFHAATLGISSQQVQCLGFALELANDFIPREHGAAVGLGVARNEVNGLDHTWQYAATAV